MSNDVKIPDIDFLEKEFKELKVNGFEKKYGNLIKEYENSPEAGASATYSRGLTKDFKEWLIKYKLNGGSIIKEGDGSDSNDLDDLMMEDELDIVEDEFMQSYEKELPDSEDIGEEDLESFTGGIRAISFDIESLPKIGKATAKKLKDAGYSTINSLATVPVKVLMEQTGVGEKTAYQITEAARQALGIDFQTGIDVWERRKNLAKISTNSTALDELLDGGIETGSMTEFFGEYRTGKTQIMHQLCVNVQLPKEQGGLEGKALYIDTEGTFRPERIIQMAEAKGLDYKKVLSNIIYVRAYSSDHQIMVCQTLQDKIASENIKLVIVDSLISHFRSEYIGRGTLADRQQKLNMHIHDLIRLADMFPEVAIVITNQVQSKPDVFFGDPTRAAGGNVIAHAATIRIYLRKGKGDQRVAKVIDAPHLPEGEAVFVLSQSGIEDV